MTSVEISRVRTRHVRSIAGVPFEYQVADDILIETPDTDAWTGSRVSDGGGPAVIVRHSIGDCGIGDLRHAMDAPPWSSYYLDEAGRPATRFHEIVSAIPARLVRTVDPGVSYEVRYERAPAVPVDQRDVELALFTLVLAARRNGLLAHGCGYVLPSGTAVLSPGMSGAGKSTLGRMLQRAAADVRVMNDDRIALTGEDRLHAWGTPWPGQGGVAHPFDGPLGALAFIRHADQCEVTTVTPRDAARRLYRMLAMPLWSGEATADALDRVDRLTSTVPLLELGYPPTDDAARWIVRTLEERVQP